MALHKGLQRLRELRFIELFLLVALYAVGLFYEFLSCAASVALCVYLMVRAAKTGSLRLRGNLLSAAVAVIALFYALSALWAVDAGMAVWGFFKYLPAPLFLLALMQDPGARERALDLLPTAAWIGISNSCLGISSFSFSHIFRPRSYAVPPCTIKESASTSSLLMRMSSFTSSDCS